MKLPGVSIVIATRNRSSLLCECLDALMNSNYPKFEVVLVNDGSTDNTEEVLKKFKKRFRDRITVLKNKKNTGWAVSKNHVIKNSKYDYIVLIDDDIIVDKDFLKNLTKALLSNLKFNVAIVSALDYHTGHSMIFVKDIMIKAGLFDNNFVRNLRQDTDLNFRVMDMGYGMKLTDKAKFIHKHPKPVKLKEKMRFSLNRLLVHEMDVLLYKKNLKRAKKFLDVKMGFLINPMRDFKTATGLWRTDRKMSLSSPEGVKMIENKTIFHTFLIISLGIVYVFLVKLVRLYGSLKYKKLLI